MELQDALAHRRLVIVGDPGSGKTTFLRRITFELADAAIESETAPPESGSHEVKRSLLERLLSVFGRASPEESAAAGRPFPLFIKIAELAEHIRNCRQRPGYPGPMSETAPSWLADFLNWRNEEMKWGLRKSARDRKSTRLNSSHSRASRMPSSA